jgi:transcriptional regulator with XRE-family HTH domain
MRPFQIARAAISRLRSAAYDLMPLKLRRALKKLGRDIAVARKKRRLTTAMMAERLGVSRMTYLRVEKGDATVGMGIYAMALFVLGLGTPFADLADVRNDDLGLLLDVERLPQRVRVSQDFKPL